MQHMGTLWGAILLLAVTEAYAAPVCTTYTIKERVPRQFIFAIPQEAESQTFMLTASVDTQQGNLYCTRTANDGAGCRVSNNPQDAVVVRLSLGSTDPDNMGAILAGFSAGDFSIGKGGWQLKCYTPQ